MAQHRQPGMERLGLRGHDVHHSNGGVGGGGPDHVAVGIRTAPHKPGRARRSGRSDKGPFRISIGAVVLVLALVFVFTLLAFYYLSRNSRGIFLFQVAFLCVCLILLCLVPGKMQEMKRKQLVTCQCGLYLAGETIEEKGSHCSLLFS